MATFAQKSEALRAFFGIAPTKPLAEAISDMNQAMGMTGDTDGAVESLPLPVQVDRLVAATGVLPPASEAAAAPSDGPATAKTSAGAAIARPENSLPIGMSTTSRQRDVRKTYLAKHKARMATLQPPADERAVKIRQYQDKLAAHRYKEVDEGDATPMPSGGFSTTLSMLTPPEGVGVFANVAKFVAAKGPPPKNFKPVTHEFRVA